MSLFKINKEEVKAANSGSSFMGSSGIYDAVIKFASVEQSSKSEAVSVNFNFEYNGNEQVVYGPFIKDKTGKDSKIGLNTIMALGVVAGMQDGEEPNIEEEEYPVGKDKEVKSFAVITQFSGLPVKVRLQEEYSKYNGEITKKMVIKDFFREDGASASEIINGTEIGKRLALVTEKYASNVTYTGCSTEEVEAWKAAKKSDTKAATTPAPKTTGARPSFIKNK